MVAERPNSIEFEPAPRWRTDLWMVAAAALLCFAVSSALDLHEMLVAWLARYERWQADELPLSIGVLAVGLAWYALRRKRELQVELALREQAERRASELLAHNRELAQQLISVQESERRALARELHDELGQRCSALLVETVGLRQAARGEAAALLPAASRAHMAAQGVYQLVGDLLRRLRPAHLDALGLLAALQELCESWELRSGVACVFHHEGLQGEVGGKPRDELSDEIEITIYRIVQESLTNVGKHALATRVHVMLKRPAPDELLLSIEDDGCGMDTRAATRGLGLLGAAERAAAVDGELQVLSQPGAGLRVTARLPLPAVVASESGATPAAAALHADGSRTTPSIAAANASPPTLALVPKSAREAA